MKNLTRRDALKLASVGAAAALQSSTLSAVESPRTPTPVWEVFELVLKRPSAETPFPSAANPFIEAQLTASFSLGHRTISVDGFYDGDGVYRIRFMPDVPGLWRYKTQSNLPQLDAQEGSFQATPPLPGAHGPVRVCNTHHFAYADNTPFFPFGTTSYAWIHQPEALQRQTLNTLRTAPFNKIRMCVFPKSYEYNHNEPALYPFERGAAGASDFTRPNPAFFRHLEQRIADLLSLGIEADLILFHPYDRWGFATMTPAQDEFYLRYLLSRLSAYRNIWWSLANEYDLMRAKSTADFDRLFHIVEAADPYQHLRSVHYSHTPYDYAQPWVTHASLQSSDFTAAPAHLAAWSKPVCYDEIMYEGNLNRRWGNISGDEMTRRFWLGLIAGCYVTHGETYLDPTQPFDENSTPTLFWAHGGPLKGTSPAQIAFLRKLIEETVSPANAVLGPVRIGLTAAVNPTYLNATAYAEDGKQAQTILYFFDFHQPIWSDFQLPPGVFAAEWIDPLSTTITPQPGMFSGKATLRLPGHPFMAVRFRLQPPV